MTCADDTRRLADIQWKGTELGRNNGKKTITEHRGAKLLPPTNFLAIQNQIGGKNFRNGHPRTLMIINMLYISTNGLEKI